MNNKKALTNSAILTAIWEETKKDNLELIKPFVEFLIGENYNVGEKINNDLIIKQMEEKFSFLQFPETILIKVYGRLKKILERKNKEYYLKEDISNKCKEFKEKQIKYEEESEKVINALMEYLKNANTNFKNIDEQKTLTLFTIFLEKNGFISIENIKGYETIDNYKRDQNNYYIAKFIIEEFEKNTPVFQYIEKIISGFMLSNAIYMQVENTNTETLKKVDIYLDTPLLLNVLNFKTKSQNDSGNLLMQLLSEKKAKVYCFRHNYEELETILENYKSSISRIYGTNPIREKTLEQFDVEKYKPTDVERVIDNLEIILNNHGIIVNETPEYIKNSADVYEGVIGEQELINFLMDNYADKNRENIEKIIEEDAKSIAAIGRIRKGKMQKKLEECKAIFVTTNYSLVDSVEIFLHQKKYEEVGYLITDIDLITVLWLKSFKSNPDLPKLKLIENARASLDLTPTMIKRIKDVLEKMEKEGIINQADLVSEHIQEINYYRRELMEKIDGDEEKINQQAILGFIDKNNNKLEQELKIEREKNKQIQEKNEKAEKEKKDLENFIIAECRRKANFIVKALKCIYTAISICALCAAVYFIIKDNIPTFGKGISVAVLFIYEIPEIIGFFKPKFAVVRRFVYRKLDELAERIFLELKNKNKKAITRFKNDNKS